jgi:opacity protein-like surface antigen
MDEAQLIENKRSRLQALINVFEQQADAFLVQHALVEDVLISSLDDYDEFDHLDDGDDMMTPGHYLKVQDGSGMAAGNPEDVTILLPSSVGWKWCSLHNAKPLAMKEAQLRHAQANDAIHQIRLALGFKSALFRTQVRPANTQQTKTRAWNAVHNIDSTLSEHARIYSMARDAYSKLRNKTTIKAELPSLNREDLRIATLVLGSETTGQRNTQQSWIWSFGTITADDGTWMNDCEL